MLRVDESASGDRIWLIAVTWPALPRSVLLALVASASFAFPGPGSVAAATSSAQAPESTVAFGSIASDAVVARKLLAVQNLVVADGARAVPSARPLARRIEQLDASMESLCTGIVHDAVVVAAARADARRDSVRGRAAPDTAPPDLSATLNRATTDVKSKMDELTTSEDISIADMFEMQMRMNQLSQLSEMATSITSATNSAIAAMARNIK